MRDPDDRPCIPTRPAETADAGCVLIISHAIRTIIRVRVAIRCLGFLPENLNDQRLTIVLVTHEQDIAQFAKRVLVFRDGKIRKDDPVASRPRARKS